MKDVGPTATEALGITYEQYRDDYAEESAIKRLKTLGEVAAIAVLLASDMGVGVTGTLWDVKGGTSL